MFFFFNTDNLKSELEDFIVDPKLVKTVEKARRQREDFVSRYPLERLSSLSCEELWNVKQRNDDFVHWLTDKTRDVTNRLPRAKYNLGLYKRSFDIHGEIQKYELFCKVAKSKLVPFLKSGGLEATPNLETCFGRPLLLKLLYLYYPDQFCDIANVDWIEKITTTFALGYGENVYERSRVIRFFISDNAAAAGWSEFSYAKDFVIEYLGLNNETNPFTNFLTQVIGFSSDVAYRYGLSLRQLSRLLVGFGFLRKSLFKILPDELFSIGENVIDNLLGNIQRNVKLCRKIRFSQKVKDFTEALQQYVEYIRTLMSDKRRIVKAPIQTYTLAGKRKARPNDECEIKRDINWAAEFKLAENAAQVVDLLQRSGLSRPYYRHYTTLSAFLCIADDWMFRLTRGDDQGMNDQLEWKRLGDEKLWKRTFIGSFSCVDGESAAMWGLYGKPSNEALRLSMDSSAMLQWLEYLQKSKDEERLPCVQFFGLNGETGEKYKLRWQDLLIMFGDVLYGGNIGTGGDAEARYIFRRKELPKKLFAGFDEKFERSPEITGFIKSADWAYEEEARLIVRVREDVPLPTGKAVGDIQYVFVPVPQNILSRVEYMKGPSVTAKLRPMIDEKLKSLFATAILSDSRYKDNLKFK